MLHDREVIFASEIEVFISEFDFEVVVEAVIPNLKKQVARLAITERAIDR